ncbi:MAG: hypothetical protein IJ728_04085 [Selenomonadaceae bacterium]|nr:hypothetical protein [Selenomonadaceae bacterium]
MSKRKQRKSQSNFTRWLKKRKKNDWNFWLQILQTGFNAVQTAISLYNALFN